MPVPEADEEGEWDGRNDPDQEDIALKDRRTELLLLPLDELLKKAHKVIVVTLLAKVELGRANHQELAVLRNLLRDNGLMMAPPTPEQERRDAARTPAAIPQLPPPEYEDT